MKTILIIEDDKDINEMLQQLLKQKGFNVGIAYSGTEAILVHNKNIDLIILDLMLPGQNGDEIIEELKKKNDVPIIVLSAISDIDKKLDLFKFGAVDYMTKPFNNEELIARINVHLKKNSSTTSNYIESDDIKLDLNNYQGICNGININLTKTEFNLLRILMKNKNQVVTKSILFDTVWDDWTSADENTLNVHISNIRNKLKKINPNKEYIETIWSIGYKFKN